jgi:hypothetical protein
MPSPEQSDNNSSLGLLFEILLGIFVCGSSDPKKVATKNQEREATPNISTNLSM